MASLRLRVRSAMRPGVLEMPIQPVTGQSDRSIQKCRLPSQPRRRRPTSRESTETSTPKRPACVTLSGTAENVHYATRGWYRHTPAHTGRASPHMYVYTRMNVLASTLHLTCIIIKLSIVTNGKRSGTFVFGSENFHKHKIFSNSDITHDGGASPPPGPPAGALPPAPPPGLPPWTCLPPATRCINNRPSEARAITISASVAELVLSDKISLWRPRSHTCGLEEGWRSRERAPHFSGVLKGPWPPEPLRRSLLYLTSQVVRSPRRTPGSARVHNVSGKHFSAALSVLCRRSTMLFDCGCYGLVWTCFAPTSLHSSARSLP
ncbi:unnamed protein product [Trichogramma brassicae]|uniref:Uncharacterized protein n=1 Tax=Trichogramma brassicae TaxID=86971 RepID=A0A6H5IYS7_9HYME|nr:unnamed protein product [Trichogramma brassicae]